MERARGYTWPRDLISLGPNTSVCNGCNVYPITHAQLCEPYHSVQLWDPGSEMEKIAQFYFDEFRFKSSKSHSYNQIQLMNFKKGLQKT